MLYNQLSDTVKRRLKFEGVCPICSQPIEPTQNIEYIKYIDGRRKNYTFFHTSCLKQARRCVNATGRV